MKAKILCVLLSLMLLFCLGFASAAYAESLSVYEGVVGTTVYAYGLSSGSSYTVKWDSTTITSGTVPTTTTEILFTVPKTSGGSHNIYIYCPANFTTPAISASFNVLPSLAIDPTSGKVGTTVTVTGNGFAASEASVAVTYGGTSVATSLSADSAGYWTTTFIVPASTTGNHAVDASGATTTAAGVTDVNFSVTPAITVSPQTGGTGTPVSVGGTGFAASESGITVTYDSTIVLSGIAAGTDGSWSGKFNLPASAGGSHTFDASGATTTASSVANVAFTVSPAITLDKVSGFVGDTITVTGSGFTQSESGINITFDGIALGAVVAADNYGQWSATRTIPGTSSGVHVITAYGSVTAASAIQSKSFSITALLTLSPAIGNVGDTINVTGSGFGKSQSIKINYADTAGIVTLTSDNGGNFTGSFKAPGGKSGQIKVVATDGSNSTATASFAMESTVPPVPAVKSPKDGDSQGFLGDTKVNFEWMPVADPSGVTYDLQLSSYKNFSALLIDRKGLTTAVYKSEESEAIPQGEYFWRLRAVDGAGNTSAWTDPILVKTGFSTTMLIIIIVAVVVLLIAIRAYVVFRKK